MKTISGTAINILRDQHGLPICELVLHLNEGLDYLRQPRNLTETRVVFDIPSLAKFIAGLQEYRDALAAMPELVPAEQDD